jgi:hypothetical protein
MSKLAVLKQRMNCMTAFAMQNTLYFQSKGTSRLIQQTAKITKIYFITITLYVTMSGKN